MVCVLDLFGFCFVFNCLLLVCEFVFCFSKVLQRFCIALLCFCFILDVLFYGLIGCVCCCLNVVSAMLLFVWFCLYLSWCLKVCARFVQVDFWILWLVSFVVLFVYCCGLFLLMLLIGCFGVVCLLLLFI